MVPRFRVHAIDKMSDFVKRVSEVSGRETGGTFRYGEMSAELSGACNGVWWLIYRRRPSESARAGDVSHRAKQTELTDSFQR